MKEYKSIYGNSGISAYKYTKDGITIRFTDGSIYLYTYESTGLKSIEIMRELAKKGVGLTTYINQQVRDKYAAKMN